MQRYVPWGAAGTKKPRGFSAVDKYKELQVEHCSFCPIFPWIWITKTGPHTLKESFILSSNPMLVNNSTKWTNKRNGKTQFFLELTSVFKKFQSKNKQSYNLWNADRYREACATKGFILFYWIFNQICWQIIGMTEFITKKLMGLGNSLNQKDDSFRRPCLDFCRRKKYSQLIFLAQNDIFLACSLSLHL